MLVVSGLKSQERNGEIVVFPNPASDSFIIKGVEGQSGVLTDDLGRRVQDIKLNRDNDYSVAVQGLSAGVYFVRLGQRVSKITVK
jgi:hypothetical protein